MSRFDVETSSHRRILFLVPSLRGGGAERVIVTLLRHLDRTRFEAHLALVEAQGPYLEDVPGDVTQHPLNTRRVRYVLPSLLRLSWRLRPHAILSTLGHLNFALILARPFLPGRTQVLVQEVTTVSALLAQESRYRQLWAWLYRFIYPRADKVICLSDCMLDDLALNLSVPRQRLVRIYNPVDFHRITELASLGVNPYPRGGPHIVAAGRLERVKGFDLLLEAMPLVRRRQPEARLTILGTGSLESVLKAQGERLGLVDAVLFAGFKSNPYPYLKDADLFVLPSRREGLPNAALEALALGTPVVATDCPSGLREVVAPGQRGLIVCQADPRSLAESILSALGSPRLPAGERLDWPNGLSRELRVGYAVKAYEDLLAM